MKVYRIIKTTWIILFTALFCLLSVNPALAQNPKSYKMYMRLGEKAYKARQYQKALIFFKKARLIDPTSLESEQYISQIKRYIYDAEEPEKKKTAVKTPKLKQPTKPQKVKKQEIVYDDEMLDEEVLDLEEQAQTQWQKKREVNELVEEYKERPKILITEMSPKDEEVFEQVLELNDELWQEQPNMQLSIELHRSVILEGANIERYLIITPGFIQMDRLDNDHVRLTATRRGETFLHIWDDQGRWTFNVEVIFPVALTKQYEKSSLDLMEQSVKPFKFFYSNQWNSLYGGEDVSKLKKRSLEYRQWMGVAGETPYGDFNSTVNFTRFDDELVATSYFAGLRDGHIWDFKNFSVRAFDTSERFSDLSLPGRNFRGILFDSYAFHRKIKYTYLQGRDQSSFANLTPGLTKKQKHFLEGARLTLFPDDPHNFTINYAAGRGANRPVELKDKVFSLVTKHKFDSTKMDTELAYDQEKWAARVRSQYEKDNTSFYWSFRDIRDGFATITGRPSGRGEIGSTFNYHWRTNKKNLNLYLDLYQDREQENPDNSNLINYDLSTNYGYQFNPKLRYSTSFFFIATPQIISERKNFRWNQSITKTLKILNQDRITFSLGNAFQASRYKLTPTSEFDRYEVSAGLQVPLFKNIFTFLNYEYSWLKEVSTGEWTNPSVATVGMTYSQPFTKRLSGNANITLRNEEDTGSQVSFLSGEDSLSTNIGFDYRVNPSTTIYVDGRLRNIWGETEDRVDFNEAEIRVGMQSSWDTPFYWNPIGAIKGFVYYDANRNGIKDKEEKGIPDVVIRVGKKTAKTNKHGKYFKRVNAKKLKIEIDSSTLPRGAFFSTESKYEANIEEHRIHRVNFGVSTQTGIYGVVYYDQNQNGKLDSRDTFLSNVSLKLDGQKTVKTDTKGGYNFYDVKPGPHTLTLDVNSLPLEYIPLIKVRNKIKVSEGITAIFNIPVKKK